jgi:hypothetical protein
LKGEKKFAIREMGNSSGKLFWTFVFSLVATAAAAAAAAAALSVARGQKDSFCAREQFPFIN